MPTDKCKKCEVTKTKQEFSYKQWHKHKASDRICLACNLVSDENTLTNSVILSTEPSLNSSISSANTLSTTSTSGTSTVLSATSTSRDSDGIVSEEELRQLLRENSITHFVRKEEVLVPLSQQSITEWIQVIQTKKLIIVEVEFYQYSNKHLRHNHSQGLLLRDFILENADDVELVQKVCNTVKERMLQSLDDFVHLDLAKNVDAVGVVR